MNTPIKPQGVALALQVLRETLASHHAELACNGLVYTDESELEQAIAALSVPAEAQGTGGGEVTDEMAEAAAATYAAHADNPDHGCYMPAFRAALEAALSAQPRPIRLRVIFPDGLVQFAPAETKPGYFEGLGCTVLPIHSDEQLAAELKANERRYAAPQPASAPVGVEAAEVLESLAQYFDLQAEWAEHSDDSRAHRTRAEDCRSAITTLAQQPAPDDSTDYRCPDCGKLNYKPLGCANCGYELPAIAQQPAAVDEISRLREALQFYADKSHFNIADVDEWDTVSGETQNLWCDNAGTATIEDGSVARAALAQPQGER